MTYNTKWGGIKIRYEVVHNFTHHLVETEESISSRSLLGAFSSVGSKYIVQRCQDLIHALHIIHTRIQFGPYEEDLAQVFVVDAISVGLKEVIVGACASNVFLNFTKQILILEVGIPS